MDKFILASKQERFHLQNIQDIFNSKVEYTPDNSFIVYDMIIKSNKKLYILEAKCRDVNYGNNGYDSVMLETKKWRDLKSEANKLGAEILYISFALNTTIIFNISKLMITNPELFSSCTYIKCPRQTMGDKTAKLKPVFFLPIELGKKIDYKI